MDTLDDFEYPRFREDKMYDGSAWDITLRRNALRDRRLIGRFACNSYEELEQLITYLQQQLPWLPHAEKTGCDEPSGEEPDKDEQADT